MLNLTDINQAQGELTVKQETAVTPLLSPSNSLPNYLCKEITPFTGQTPIGEYIFSNIMNIFGITDSDIPPFAENLLSVMSNAISLLEADTDSNLQTINQICRNTFEDLREQQKQLLLQAGVNSHQELRVKQTQLANYQALAEQEYLKNENGYLARIEIDCKLIQAEKGEISPEERNIVEQFWTSASKSAEWQKELERLHQKFMEGVSGGLVQTIEDIFRPVEESPMNQNPLSIHQILKDYYNTTLQKIQIEMQEQWQKSDEDARLVINYFALTAPFIWEIVKNSTLREVKIKEEQQAEEKMAFLINWAQKDIDIVLKSRQEELEHAKENLNRFENRCKNRGEDVYDALREDYQQTIIELEAEISELRTPKSLEGLKEYIHKTTGKVIKPPSIDFDNCQPTALETLMKKMLMVELGLDPQDNSEINLLTLQKTSDSSLSLDLTQIPDPVTHFVQQKREIDQKKLEIVPKIEVLDS